MPVETDTSGEPKGLEEKLILKDPRSPRKTLLHLTDWPRIEHEEEINSLTREGGLHMGRIAGKASCLRSVWQQEIVGLLTYRQIKCQLSKM